MQVTAQMVRELRDRTGAPMMDCKRALLETEGDQDRAVDVLRKRGVAAAARKAGRATAEGLVGSYIHAGGRIGVLIEVNCETDFVARTDEFQELVKDLAMQVAASDPSFVSREDAPPDLLEREREIYREQVSGSGKPPEIVERVVEGKLKRFFADNALLEQPFVKDPDRTVEQLVTEKIAKLGENIRVSRFARFKLGENAAGAGAEAEEPAPATN